MNGNSKPTLENCWCVHRDSAIPAFVHERELSVHRPSFDWSIVNLCRLVHFRRSATEETFTFRNAGTVRYRNDRPPLPCLRILIELAIQ